MILSSSLTFDEMQVFAEKSCIVDEHNAINGLKGGMTMLIAEVNKLKS